MKNKNVLLIARFSVQNFKVSVEIEKIVHSASNIPSDIESSDGI